MFQQTPQKRVLFVRTLKSVALGVLSVATILYGGFALHPQTASAIATSSTVNFQARLEGTGGNIAADGLYNIQFKLYNVSSAGSALWTESYYDANGVTAGQDNRVQVTNGYVTVNLGSQTAFSGINWDQDLFLTMNVGGTTQTATPTYDGEMSPRLKLTAVPYAFSAGKLSQYNGTTGFTSTLSILQPTVGNQTFQIQDQGAAGTYNLCIQATTACGFAATTGGTGYVQNQSALQQASTSFWISGIGRSDTALQAPSFDTPTAVALNIGTTNATSVTLGKSGVNTFVGGNLSVGTTVSSGAITIANSAWITGVDSAGTGTVNLFQINGDNEIQVGAALNIDGGIILPTNGGQMTLSDLPIDSTATAGTPESYTLRVGSSNALTVYGEADGSGNVQNVRISIGPNIAPAYTLDVVGDINTSSVYRVAGTSGATTTCSSGNVLQNAVVTGGIITGGTCIANGASTTTLQNVYDNSSSPATITLTSTNLGIKIKDASTTVGGDLFSVQNNAGSTKYLNVTTSGASVAGTFAASTALQAPSLDVASAGALTIGGTNATSISIGKTGSNITTTVNGLAVFKPTTGNDSTTAFQIQNAAAVRLLTVDTVNGQVVVNTPTATGSAIAKIVVNSNWSDAAGDEAQLLFGENAVNGNRAGKLYFQGGPNTTALASLDSSGATVDVLKFGNSGSGVVLVNSGSAGENLTISNSNTTASSIVIKPTTTGTNSQHAIQLQNGGGTAVLDVDTTNNRIGIGTVTPGYTLDVVGDINTSSVYRVAGTSGATTTCSSGNVLQNAVVTGGIITGGTCIANGASTTTLQNVYDNSSSPATITLTSTNLGIKIKDASTTVGGDLFSVQNNAGSTKYLNVTTSGASVAGTFAASTALQAPSLDVASAGALTIGGTNATSISIGKQSTSNIATTIYGTTVIKPTAGNDSATAFQLQNAAGTSNLFVADTANGKIGIGQAPSGSGAALQVTGGIAATSGDINAAAGNIQTAGNTRITNTGNLQNIGTISATGFTTQSNGQTLFKNTSDTTTAFQIQNAAGASLITADTTNMAINVSNGVLNVNGLSAPAAPAIALASGGTLAFSTTYQYRLAATNAAGRTNAVNSSPTSVTTAGSGTTRTVNITWSAVTGATGYYLYRSTDGGVTWYRNTIAGGATVSAADNGTNFTWSGTDYSSDNIRNLTNQITLQQGGILNFDTSGNAFIGEAATSGVLSIMNTNQIGIQSNSGVFIGNRSTGATWLDLSSTGTALFKNSTDSATAFQIQNASSTPIFNVDSSTQTVTIGSATNGVIMSATGLSLAGTARSAKTIYLPAEYAGSVLDPGSGSNNNGTMTSGYDSTNRKNYYKWTTAQATNQSYDVVVQVPIPDTYSALSGSTPLCLQTYTSNTTNGTITMEVRDSSNVVVSNYSPFLSFTPGSTGTWVTSCGAISGSPTFTPGDTINVRIRMQSPTSGDVRIGSLSLTYLSNK